MVHEVRLAIRILLTQNYQRGRVQDDLCLAIWIGMPFGLANAPSNFQTLMNKLFQPFLDCFIVVYWVDIVMYSKTFPEHIQHLQQVFQLLRDNQLYVKGKCDFVHRMWVFRARLLGAGHCAWMEPGCMSFNTRQHQRPSLSWDHF